MTEYVSYGNLDKTVLDIPVTRRGSSYVLTITRIMDMMGLHEGELVRVTIEKMNRDEEDD